MQHLLYGREQEVNSDSGYVGAENCAESQGINAALLIAEKLSKLCVIKNKSGLKHARCWEHLKASVGAKVDPSLRVVKRQFGCIKARYRGLAKNTA